MKYLLDAGTTWSKIAEIYSNEEELTKSPFNSLNECKKIKSGDFFIRFFIVPSIKIKNLNLKFDKATGHMIKGLLKDDNEHQNEIISLAYGIKHLIPDFCNGTIIDIGSRDTKWIRFKNGNYVDLDWNNSCGSATGATIEMLFKFYENDGLNLNISEEKYPVTCGVFAMEKIMDDIAGGIPSETALSKYIHGIAYNTWVFARKPKKIYLSGGFCENLCFVNSLKKYCEVETLGRFVLLMGLVN